MSHPTATEIRPAGRQLVALVLLVTASFTLAVDFSVLTVALPTIGADIGFPLSDLQWVATVFALSAAGCTLLCGRIADRFGRRRLFLLGMALLGAASLLGGLAVDPAMLLIARAAQGLATAMVTPAALALLTTTFPEGRLRERALGLNGALMAAGFTAGSILGGVLTELATWRWAFFLNVPVATFALLAAPVVLVESRGTARLDIPGAVTVTLGLLALIYAVTTGSPVAFLASALLLTAFWLIERRAPAPLIPPTMLRRRTIAWANLAGLLAFLTETSLVFLLTLYLQRTLHFAPLAAGLCFAVLGVGTVLGGLLGPRIIARIGSPRAILLGFAVQAIATAPLILLGQNPAWLTLLLTATFLGGIANLVAIVGFMVTATTGVPAAEAGLATGLTTMSQQIGITLGIPIMSALATAHPTHTLAGIHIAITANTTICLAALLLTIPLWTTRTPVDTPHHPAANLK